MYIGTYVPSSQSEDKSSIIYLHCDSKNMVFLDINYLVCKTETAKLGNF
jgi:hypothetical protein